MPALFLGAFLILSIPDTTLQVTPCDSLYHQALGHLVEEPTSQDREQFLAASRAARTCYGNQVITPVLHLYREEIAALHYLSRGEEGLRYVENLPFQEPLVLATSADSAQAFIIYMWGGYLYHLKDDLGESARYYAKAADIASSDSPLEQAMLYLDAGTTFLRLNDLSSSLTYIQAGDEALDRADPNHPRWRYQKGRSLSQRVDHILVESTSKNPVDTSAFRRASQFARQSLTFFESYPQEPNAIEVQSYLAEALSFLGDLEGATWHLGEAQKRVHLVVDSTKRSRALSLLLLKRGRVEMQLGEYDQAEASYLQALDHTSIGELIPRQRRALRDLGLLHEKLGNLDQALHYFYEAAAVMRPFHNSIRMTDWAANAFGHWQGGHRHAVRVLLVQNKVREAFLTLEQTRAGHFQDLRMLSQQVRDLPLDKHAHFDSLTVAYVDTRNQLASDTLVGDARNALATREQVLIAERASLLQTDLPLVAPSIDSLQQVLAERNQVLLSYYIDAHEFNDQLFDRPAQSYVFVLTEDTLAAVPLTLSALELRGMIAEVSPLLASSSSTPDYNAQQFSLSALYQLYQVLVEPVVPFISNSDRLVVLPDGPLHQLPLGMLMEAPSPAFQYREAPFLFKKFAISTELSTALLVEGDDSEQPFARDVFALGLSDFSDFRQGSTSGSGAPDSLFDLPSVEDELALLQRRFSSVLSLSNAQATQYAFADQAPSSRVLHLASHTVVDTSSPLMNAIYLSPEDSLDNALLFLHEIQQLGLSSELVVLSGCSTARGIFNVGEGMTGLQYAFRASGVKSSLSTLWYVDDDATVRLVDRFYHHLVDGSPKDIALQQAQWDYFKTASDDLLSPFFWAAPVLYGNTRPVALEGRSRFWLWLVAVTGCILLFALFLWRRGVRLRSFPG